VTWPTAGTGFAPQPGIVVPFAAPVAVSTEIPLLAFIEWGPFYSQLIFTLKNEDLVKPAAFYLDRSESGVVPSQQRMTVIVGANKEEEFLFADVRSRYFSLSAAGDPDGGFPSVNVTWQVLGVRRLR
jgi:hypothetical protein